MFQLTQQIGRLGSDPIMRYTQNGEAVTNISVASDHVYTDAAGQKVKQVIWIRWTFWGKTAENINTYMKKGSKVHVMGRLVADDAGNPRTFQRKDGTIGTSFEANGDRCVFLDSKDEAPTGSGGSTTGPSSAGVPDDDIPF